MIKARLKSLLVKQLSVKIIAMEALFVKLWTCTDPAIFGMILGAILLIIGVREVPKMISVNKEERE